MWRTAWKTSFQDSLIMQNFPGVGQDGKLYKTRFLKGILPDSQHIFKSIDWGDWEGTF